MNWSDSVEEVDTISLNVPLINLSNGDVSGSNPYGGGFKDFCNLPDGLFFCTGLLQGEREAKELAFPKHANLFFQL